MILILKSVLKKHVTYEKAGLSSKAYLSRLNVKQRKRPICLQYFFTFVMLRQLDTFILPPKFKSWIRT